MEENSASVSQQKTQDIKNISGSTQGQQEAQSKEENDSPSVNKSKSVLIVEDDDFLRGLLSNSLSDVGYKVDNVRNAEEALNFLKENIPNIILLDLMLPGMNGLEFLSEIKKTQEVKSSVVILSNLGNKEDIDKALSLGVVDFIVKANVTPKQIVGKVQEILGDGV
jgi:CheY-like chemotaxis protein